MVVSQPEAVALINSFSGEVGDCDEVSDHTDLLSWSKCLDLYSKELLDPICSQLLVFEILNFVTVG